MTLTFSDSVSALRANGRATSSTSDALANAFTHGYKEYDSFFRSLVTGSGGDFSSGGVLNKNLQNVAAQGVIENSSSSTHLAISGNGLFITSKDAAALDVQYTRAGHFAPDRSGNLVNASDNFLMGWPVDNTGTVPATVNRADPGSLIPINVNQAGNQSQATSTLSMTNANLPSSDPVGQVRLMQLTVYDSLGESRTLTVTWTKTAIDTWEGAFTSPSAPNANITRTAGGTPYNGATPLVVVFGGDGTPATFDGGAAMDGITIDWDNAQTFANNAVISLDFGTVGQRNGITSNAGEYVIPSIDQDGREIGQLRSVSVNNTGLVSAIFSNGQELALAQIALANFPSVNNLEHLTGNAWIQTQQSGNFIYDFPKTGGFGEIVASALEKSTVDISEKITDLIELQNHYISNTKAISTKKSMFDALMSIK